MKINQILGLLLIGCICISCGQRIKGNGNVIEREIEVSAFTELEVSGIFEIELVSGKPGLQIIADENLHEHIHVENDGNELVIHSNDKLLDGEKMLLRVYYKDLREIDVSGASEISSKETLKGNEFKLDVSGASEVDLDVKLEHLILDLSGGSEIHLTGKVDFLEIDVSGAAEIKAAGLKTNIAHMDITGAGEIEVDVKDELDVDVTGAGEVKYWGDPKVKQNITGAGEIKQMKS